MSNNTENFINMQIGLNKKYHPNLDPPIFGSCSTIKQISKKINFSKPILKTNNSVKNYTKPNKFQEDRTEFDKQMLKIWG